MTLYKTTQPRDSSAGEAMSAALAEALRAVDNVMARVVNSDVTVLKEASHHILEAGGKRLRPRLLLLSYAASGGADIAYAAPVAAAIELMHTASVVHDDINDHGVLRRGRPSVNAIWGRTFALLTGDFLFTKVYELMAPYGNLNALLAEAAVALVEGETLQASAVKENRLNHEVYFDIIGRKTAALFRAAGRMGGELAGAPDEHVHALGQFGYSVGLAFQIIDDVLDLTADSARLGKTAGIDLAQGKGFAAAHVVNGRSDAANGNVSASDPMESIKRKLLSGNAIDEARQQAYGLAEAAIAMLGVLPSSEAKHELIELAYSVVRRDF